jgi:hypothetical protein
MWPAGIEPAAPRVSGGRSTGLSYGHVLAASSDHVRPLPNDLVQATRLPFDPGSCAADCATGEHTSYVEERWSPSHGVDRKIRTRKQTLTGVRHSSATPRVFLSQAGPRVDLALLQAEHHLVCTDEGRSHPGTKKATLGSPSSGFALRLVV